MPPSDLFDKGTSYESTRQGAIQLAPGRGQRPKTSGQREAPTPTTLVVALTHPSATTRVDYYITDSFPASRSGHSRPSDWGLAEWHPHGCSPIGYHFREDPYQIGRTNNATVRLA